MAKTEKKVEKFQVKCLNTFRDKHTGKIRKAGDIFKVNEERFKEILEVDKLVEKYTEPVKAETAKADK